MWARTVLAAVSVIFVFVRIEVSIASPIGIVIPAVGNEIDPSFPGNRDRFGKNLKAKLCAMAEGSGEDVVVFNRPPQQQRSGIVRCNYSCAGALGGCVPFGLWPYKTMPYRAGIGESKVIRHPLSETTQADVADNIGCGSLATVPQNGGKLIRMNLSQHFTSPKFRTWEGRRLAVGDHFNFLNRNVGPQLLFGIGDGDLIACDGCACGIVSGFNGGLHVAGLNKFESRKATCRQNQADSSYRNGEGRVIEAFGVSGQVRCELNQPSIQIRLFFTFASLIGAFGLSLWGWKDVYGNRCLSGGLRIGFGILLSGVGLSLSLFPDWWGWPL